MTKSYLVSLDTSTDKKQQNYKLLRWSNKDDDSNKTNKKTTVCQFHDVRIFQLIAYLENSMTTN